MTTRHLNQTELAARWTISPRTLERWRFTGAFKTAGVPAALIHGEMGDADRKATLAAYDRGEIQVITNVAVLTEGWDHPPTSCVVLLRPSSYKSTMMQMVGRGLRTLNPEEYPGVLKTDCVILDFGTSSLIHGSLEQDVDLNGREVSWPTCAGRIRPTMSIMATAPRTRCAARTAAF